MKIIFFDGHCILCNGLVDWLLKTDKMNRLNFAPLQGESAKKILSSDLLKFDYDTVIYLRDDKIYEKSSAIIMIFTDLGGLWKFSVLFLIVPKCIRDFLYNKIAKNRYLIFGKKETCRLPTEKEQEKLLP